MISSKQALLILLLAAAVACVASAAEGPLFYEKDLEGLVDHPIPAGAMLVGEYVYMGMPRDGFHTFTSFKLTAGKVEFGNLLLIVSFPDGFPSNIKIGSVIKPDLEHPLLVELVRRSPNQLFIIVRATFRDSKQ